MHSVHLTLQLRTHAVLRPFFPGTGWAGAHKGETYWNNHWIFMSRMSFLSCHSTYSVKALQENPVVWSSFYIHGIYITPYLTVTNSVKALKET